MSFRTRMISDKIPSLAGEEWKAICDNAGYEVSNLGRIKSYKHKEAVLLKLQENNRGYIRVALSNKGKCKYHLVHRLVAKAFILNDDPIEKTTVDHKDGNKKNNNADNLQWLSLADNIKAYNQRKIIKE